MGNDKSRAHDYTVRVVWTGDRGTGTSSYRAYGREHEITSAVEGRPPIPGSSDPAFRGDPARWNPEEMLVATLSTCHMLWYLHLCAVAGIVVIGYEDNPTGVLRENSDSSGEFVSVTLHPLVAIAAGDPAKAQSLHDDAHHFCYIARSVNFPVICEPQIVAASA